MTAAHRAVPSDEAPFLDWALYYAEVQRWPVFPCMPREKRPLVEHGFKAATIDSNVIREWWAKYPQANVSSPCGPKSGHDAIDIESDGIEVAEGIPGYERWSTFRLATPKGGFHVLVKPEPGLKNAVKLIPGIDLRTEGGYTLLPPSHVVYEDGTEGRYRWIHMPEPDSILPSMPPEIINLAKKDRAETRRDVPNAALRKSATIDSSEYPEGQRNDLLFRMGSRLRASGFDDFETFAALKALNESRCSPKLGLEEVEGICRSVIGFDPGQPESPAPVTLRLVKVGDLVKESPEEHPYLVDGLLVSGGLSLLAAKPKVGKSTLIRWLAMCVARGHDFLGRACVQGPVIYLAFEEKRDEVRAMFKAMGVDDSIPLFMHFGAAPLDLLDQLGDLIKQHGAKLAILDPLFRAVKVKDGNDYAAMYAALEPVLEHARKSGCHILGAHHLGKGAKEEGDDVLGSTAIFGAVDTLIRLCKRGDKRIISSNPRYGPVIPDTVLNLDLDSYEVSVGDTVREVQTQDTRSRILVALHGEIGKTEERIREMCGGDLGRTSRVLRQMVEGGEVLRAGTGRKGDAYQYSLLSTSLLGENENRENECEE